MKKKIIDFDYHWEEEIRKALKEMGLIEGKKWREENTKTGKLILEFIED